MIDLIKDLKNVDDSSTRLLTDEIYQELKDGNQDCSVDIGIGRIDVHIDDKKLNFRFIPSDALIDRLESRLCKNRKVLIEALEEKVVKKFIEPVEEIFP